MDPNQEHLKEKALLLLRRERELFELRMKHQQVTLWLELTQKIPGLFSDPQAPILDSYAALRKALVGALRWQRVSLLEFDGSSLRPLVPGGPERPLAPEAAALIRAELGGFCNDPTDATVGALAETLGLARFVWSRIEVRGCHPVVVAGGFDSAKAKFQSPFEGSEAAHLRNIAQLVEGVLGNRCLVKELQQERDQLQNTNVTLAARERELQAATEGLRVANETLELRVKDRTLELARRNQDMRLVLDHVEQGLVMLDREGRVGSECSRQFTEAFGASAPGTPFERAISTDEKQALGLRWAFRQLIDDVLPIDLLIEQMPQKLVRGARTHALSFTPVLREGSIDAVLLMTRDVTREIAAHREEVSQSQQLKALEWIMRDWLGFRQFLAESRDIMTRIAENRFADPRERMRLVHTLKGNSAMFDATAIADAAHALERTLVEHEDEGSARSELCSAWTAYLERIEPLLRDGMGGQVALPREDFDRVVAEVRAHTPHARILRTLMSFAHEPVRHQFKRVEQQLTTLARRLGKAETRVRIDDGAVRIPVERFRPFWSSFVHVVRNMADHGLEPESERVQKGKPRHNVVDLRARLEGDLVIEIADDGRGIDWDAVAKKAAERNLPADTRADLTRALFADGVSTAAQVSELSGRGVGLSAISAVCSTLHGSVAVDSSAGQGTRFRFVFPCPDDGFLDP